jgi:tRNA threonylcarbamoyladenosine modification (KEOPS) complex Cgi121 subunit
MEILLFVSGTRQISEAVKRVGISPETVRTAALAVLPAGDDHSKVTDYLAGVLNEKADDSLLDQWTSRRKSTVVRTFGIGDKELKATIREDEKTEKAIERLAIERSAMLAIAK